MRVLISLQLLSEIFFIPRKIELDSIINADSSSCRVPVILATSYRNLNFLNRVSKYVQISNFMKIRQVEAELFHADGEADRQTDRRT